jgi:hypothetical protein
MSSNINPIGADGAPMEKHHDGRIAGPTRLVMKTIHDMIHRDERAAVAQVPGFKGSPGCWTAKNID